MRTKRINFPIIPPKYTSGKIHVPEHLPALHGIQIWVGRRNAGKTVAATNLIRKYMDAGAIERVILVTPTYQSNVHTFAPLKINGSDDVIEPSKDAVQRIKEKLEVEKNTLFKRTNSFNANLEDFYDMEAKDDVEKEFKRLRRSFRVDSSRHGANY